MMPGHSQASGPYPAPEGSPVAPSPIDYTYTHAETLATTGYFSCEPPSSLSLEAALAAGGNTLGRLSAPASSAGSE
ncbi:MAG: hypothetical protein ACLU98_03840 [Desulfovibrio fairfieldensis]